jgi:hypothetical protein
MKTTLEVSAPLLEAAKALAARERTTLRALVEEGLRIVLERKKKERPFRLRDATFKGKGLHPDVAGRRWADVRDAIYEGRGG